MVIKNLRCVRDLRLTLEPMTALLGRNGVGKSCILHAADIFYNPGASVSDEDFFNRDTSQAIEIQVTYGHLRPDELKEFAPYLSRDRLTVTKRIADEGGRRLQRYYAAVAQHPGFADIRAVSGARERITRWNELASSQEMAGLRRVRTAADVDAEMAAFESSHPELLVPIQREEQFFGPPNVGGGKLDNYTRFVLIPAVRDVSDELAQRRGSSLYQLLDLIVLRRIEAREDIVAKRLGIQEQIRELYHADNLPELRELGTGISALLGRIFPGAELLLDWDEVKAPDLPLPMARPTLVEDEFRGEISKKGHGLQRALLITLLQFLAQSSGPADTTMTDGGGSVNASEPANFGPSLIVAIEEPELYLHPLRCRYLFGLLRDLTQPSQHGAQHANQVLFASHSPHFVSLHQFESIRIVRKVKAPGIAAPESVASSFTVSDALKRISQIAGLDRSRLTVDSFRAHTIPVMASLASEGFFADAVVLVEGFGDAGVLTRLQERLEKNWLARGIAVIPVDGKTNLDRPALIFQGLGIPTYLVFDGDKESKGKRKREANAIRTNRLLLRLLGAPEEDFPASRVESRWAAFEHDLEHELAQCLGKEVFDGLCGEVAEQFCIDSTQVMKNLHCSSVFADLAYGQGYSLPFLERIVEAASRLVP